MIKYLIVVLVLFTMVSCVSEVVNPYTEPPLPIDFCDTIATSFQTDITPLLNNSCATSGCHKPAGPFSPNLESHDDFVSIINSGKYQDRVVTKKGTAAGMPPSNAVDSVLLAKIDCWIENGSNNN